MFYQMAPRQILLFHASAILHLGIRHLHDDVPARDNFAQKTRPLKNIKANSKRENERIFTILNLK